MINLLESNEPTHLSNEPDGSVVTTEEADGVRGVDAGDDPMYEPRYQELATFMRAPYQPDLTGVDIAMYGVPYDGGVTNRPGVCPRYRHAGSRWHHNPRGTLPAARLARPEPGWRRRRGGVATIRPERQHRLGRCHADVRDPLSAGRITLGLTGSQSRRRDQALAM